MAKEVSIIFYSRWYFKPLKRVLIWMVKIFHFDIDKMANILFKLGMKRDV